MVCTWLKPKRKARDLTQEKVAGELDLDVRSYRFWERCEKSRKKNVPYIRLARLLKVSAVQLCEDHLRDLEAAGLDEHAAQARKALGTLPRAAHFPPADPAPIEAALEACAATGLPAAIGERTGLHSAAQQAASIARWLGEGDLKGDRSSDLDALLQVINPPLKDAIAHAAGQEQCAALWQFLLAVIRAAAASDPDINGGGRFPREGEDRAWPYRVTIDKARQLNGMRTVTVRPDESDFHYLDDSRDSTRAVRFRDLTQTSVEGRVHQLVAEIAATLEPDKKPPPPVSERRAFKDYCSRLNGVLPSYNFSDSHVFALCEPDSQEPDEVKEGVLDRLPNLSLFDCADPSGNSSVLRVDRDALDSWYALHLDELLKRGLNVDPQPESQSKPEPEPEPTADEPPPKEEAMSGTAPQLVFNINQQNGNDNNSTQAGRDAQIAQQTTTALPDQVADLLEQVLSDTKDRKQETKELRQAALKAQAELEAEGSVTSTTKQLLKSAFDALPKADALIKTGTNLLALIAKLSGAGA